MDGMPNRKMQWSAWIMALTMVLAAGILYMGAKKPSVPSKPGSAVARQTTTAKHLAPRKEAVRHVRRHGSKVSRVTVYVNGVRYVAAPSPRRHHSPPRT